MCNYDSIIFDKDGVLLDSGLDNFHWMDKARVKKAEERGIKLSIEDSVEIVKASTVEDLEEFMDRKGMTWRDMREIEKSLENAKIEMIKQGIIWLFPEAKETVQDIDKPIALATNAPRKVTDFTLEKFKIQKEFETVKSNSIDNVKDYIRRRKPDPVMLEEIMEENNFSNPLMVGDTSSDIGAAENAGIDSAQVLNYRDSANGNADYKINNLSEVKNII